MPVRLSVKYMHCGQNRYIYTEQIQQLTCRSKVSPRTLNSVSQSIVHGDHQGTKC